MPGLDPVEHLVKTGSRDRGETCFLGGIIFEFRRYRRPDIPRRVPLVRSLPPALRYPRCWSHSGFPMATGGPASVMKPAPPAC